MPVPSKRIIQPGARIRVLVVDDSVVIRRLVAHALEEDPLLEVVGAAPNGSIALQKIPQLNPDVVTLDIEMPEMDGLETLRRMRPLYPQIHTIMFSTLTERGASITLEALSAGADDYVTKASNAGSLDRSLDHLRTELIPKIKQFFRIATSPESAIESVPRTATVGFSRPAGLRSVGSPRVVALGVSTGGPTALSSIIPQIPPSFPLPVLIVQHMPPLFTRLLADRLQTLTSLKVEEATMGALVEPGKILLAPGDYHMRVRQRGTGVVVALDQSPPENSCRPAVDALFTSVSEIYGSKAICAVLTGMGQDGLRGTQQLKHCGACIIAQDENSSVVWGMPGAVVNAGLADAVVPLSEVVPEILRRADRQ
jgi:two-component system chemotaxis response regulator CheB